MALKSDVACLQARYNLKKSTESKRNERCQGLFWKLP